MKIRNGFVSNSSSSSFIVVGFEVQDSDIPKIVETAKLNNWLNMSEAEEQAMNEIIAEFEETGDIDYYDLPFVGGSIEWYKPEYGDLMFGFRCDPTELNVDECVSGWIDEEDFYKLSVIAGKLDKRIISQGGTEYC